MLKWEEKEKKKAIKAFKIVHFYWLFSSDTEAVSRERFNSQEL